MDEIVAGLLAGWADAYSRQDAVGLSALYSDDALFYGSTPALRCGPADIEQYFAALLPMEGPAVVFTDVIVVQTSENTLEGAMVATFSSSRGALPMRLTQAYARRTGQWQITSHHASRVG